MVRRKVRHGLIALLLLAIAAGASATAHATRLPAPPAVRERATVTAAAAPIERWLWPLAERVITQFFRQGEHYGLDLSARAGTSVHASWAGTVAAVGTNGAYGLRVVLDHGEGVQTLYAHLGRALVVRGQAVEAGEILGRVGMTGHTTGPHLHFAVRRDGRWVDPLLRLLGGE
jgi:murein DD-endopeptidase MepM/ murein hydrolase activator NlpD